jgi:hypothetical protein
MKLFLAKQIAISIAAMCSVLLLLSGCGAKHLTPQESNQLFGQGIAFLEQGKPDEALKIWDAILQHDGSNSIALICKGVTIAIKGDPKTAGGYFDSALTNVCDSKLAPLRLVVSAPKATGNFGMTFSGLLYAPLPAGIDVSRISIVTFPKGEDVFIPNGKCFVEPSEEMTNAQPEEVIRRIVEKNRHL